MTDHSLTAAPLQTAIPADDPGRMLTVAGPDDPSVRHVSVVGDTYSILVSGAQTDGRYCLIDMLVPDGSGPPPHRHDFEEMFTLLDGELESTCCACARPQGRRSSLCRSACPWKAAPPRRRS